MRNLVLHKMVVVRVWVHCVSTHEGYDACYLTSRMLRVQIQESGGGIFLLILVLFCFKYFDVSLLWWSTHCPFYHKILHKFSTISFKVRFNLKSSKMRKNSRCQREFGAKTFLLLLIFFLHNVTNWAHVPVH